MLSYEFRMCDPRIAFFALLHPPLAPGPVFFTQDLFEDFSRPALGQVVHKLDGFGDLEAGEVSPAVLDDLGFRRTAPRLQSDECLGNLTPGIIRHGDDRALENSRKTIEDALDFRRSDIFS